VPDKEVEVLHWNGVIFVALAEQACKGIFGRGVLLDYARWAKQQNITYDAFSTHSVTIDDLARVAHAQGEHNSTLTWHCLLRL